MPADLKLKEVAREIVHYLHSAYMVDPLSMTSSLESVIKSRLQTLVAEVRAQAMEEAERRIEELVVERSKRAQEYFDRGEMAASDMHANRSLGMGLAADEIKLLRRRASGKDE
jgi:hypothetical protein